MEPFDILNKVNTPADLKSLNPKELDELCAQLRAFLLENVSKTGGHLASNLGVVEQTVAIHRVFDMPKDQVVFDVGHQCYIHKILTGRRQDFHSLRKFGGLSGFPKPQESEYDSFATGHSSTSISAALGLLKAKNINNEDGHVVAVIGDGSLTGGMAYEALNNAGRSKSRIIIVLNDNTMSISKNVGAIARHLTKIRSTSVYFRTKDATQSILIRIPLVGKKIASLLQLGKRALKSALYSSNIFEQMGFEYMGPIDGHDLDASIQLLERAKSINAPAVIHMMTVKGKGYPPAERYPDRFHGISSFDLETGETPAGVANFSCHFGDTIYEMAKRDGRICAVTAAMESGTGLSEFAKNIPERYFDCGIAEQHAVTFCAGLAKNGLVPVFAVYSTFLQRSYDQIIHDVALQKLKVVFAVDRAGLVGADGETHHGVFDASFLNNVPNLTVYSPSSYEQLDEALHTAVYKNVGPVAVRYPRGGQVELLPPGFECDTFAVYGSQNAPVAIVSYGRQLEQAALAQKILSQKGVEAFVVGIKKIKPLDMQGLLPRLSGAGHIFFAEEGIRTGGIGQTFQSELYTNGYRGGFTLFAIDDTFVPHGSLRQLLTFCGLDEDSLAAGILKELRP